MHRIPVKRPPVVLTVEPEVVAGNPIADLMMAPEAAEMPPVLVGEDVVGLTETTPKHEAGAEPPTVVPQ